MKTNFFCLIGLVLQLLFLLFYLFAAPEPSSRIRVGLERLKVECPNESAKIPETINGAVPVQTSGDFYRWLGWVLNRSFRLQ
jgi:hypothetical protein